MLILACSFETMVDNHNSLILWILALKNCILLKPFYILCSFYKYAVEACDSFYINIRSDISYLTYSMFIFILQIVKVKKFHRKAQCSWKCFTTAQVVKQRSTHHSKTVLTLLQIFLKGSSLNNGLLDYIRIMLCTLQ